jgi:hypothetical protein
MMFGVLLIFVVLVFPQGIAGGLAALAAKMKRIQPWRRYEQS